MSQKDPPASRPAKLDAERGEVSSIEAQPSTAGETKRSAGLTDTEPQDVRLEPADGFDAGHLLKHVGAHFKDVE